MVLRVLSSNSVPSTGIYSFLAWTSLEALRSCLAAARSAASREIVFFIYRPSNGCCYFCCLLTAVNSSWCCFFILCIYFLSLSPQILLRSFKSPAINSGDRSFPCCSLKSWANVLASPGIQSSSGSSVKAREALVLFALLASNLETLPPESST